MSLLDESEDRPNVRRLPIIDGVEKQGFKMPPRHLADLDLAGRRAAVAEIGLPESRATELSQHYFGGAWATTGSTVAPNIPSEASEMMPTLLTHVRETVCDDGATRKKLWRLHDGTLVESVLMGFPERVTLCVSSQAGCGMGCPFCATGQAGLTRNLSTAEIVEQVVAMAALTKTGVLTGAPNELTHLVFMGMGEPLANYPRLIQALRRLTDPSPEGLGLQAPNIMVSTVGLVPAMKKLADANTGVTLAVSLHAPDNELRDELVPVNLRWPISEVLDAAWRFARNDDSTVWVEYVLIKDVNDQPWRAAALADLLRDKPAHINLIPLNPTPGSKWDASPKETEAAFLNELRAAGVSASVRNTRGAEIEGACGQLAANLA